MEKELKVISENEETRWMKLKQESKNEARIRIRRDQLFLDLAKARERLQGVDEDREDDSDVQCKPSSSEMNQTMRKALGNMFSILPKGGEEAMSKILTGKARHAITKTSYQEVELKTEKENQALEVASASKAKAIEFYLNMGNTLIETTGENQGWESTREIFNAVVESVKNFVIQRYLILRPSLDTIKSLGESGPLDDSSELMKKMKEKHVKQLSDTSNIRNEMEVFTEGTARQNLRKGLNANKFSIGRNSSTYGSGFLPLNLEKSSTIQTFLSVLKLRQENSNEEQDYSTSETMNPSNVENSNCILMEKQVENMSETQIKKTLVKSHEENQKLNSDEIGELLSLANFVKEFAECNIAESVNQGASLNLSVNEKFYSHFFEGAEDEAEKVIKSFSCAYWPKEEEGYIAPLLQGRMFTTENSLYFVGWGEKKIVLKWKDITAVTKEATMMGTIENAILVTYLQGGKQSSYFFGSFVFRDSCFQLLTRLTSVAHSLHKISNGITENTSFVNKISRDNREESCSLNEIKNCIVPPDETLKKWINSKCFC